MCDCLPKMLCVYCIYIYIYHVNKFEARLLFLYLPLKKVYFNLQKFRHKGCERLSVTQQPLTLKIVNQLKKHLCQ